MGKDEVAADLLIIGAGPAGCSAALTARGLGLRVTLLERSASPQARTCSGWLGPAGVALCETLGATVQQTQAEPLVGLRMFSWDFKKTARVDDGALRGWRVERTALDAALRKAAVKAQVRLLAGAAVTSVQLGEDGVWATTEDGVRHSGALLIIADGPASATAAAAHLAPSDLIQRLTPCMYAEFADPAAAPQLDVAFGNGREGRLATLVHGGGRIRVTLLGGSQPDLHEHFSRFVQAARAAKVLPAEGSALGQQQLMLPAGLALEMEAHAGKRCLLAGDAGGFVSAFSTEGIYPAMRSGQIAAECAAAALQSRLVQDALAAFSSQWRTHLADYLRLPNADLSLMPLLFANPRIAERLARAFLLGHQF